MPSAQMVMIPYLALSPQQVAEKEALVAAAQDRLEALVAAAQQA